MTPVLFPTDATEYRTQGLGALTDAIRCEVTEERNGIYELYMEYPAAGIHYDEIKDRCIVYAIPSPYRLPQPFRIYRITRPLNGIASVYARHISYDLAGVPLKPFTATSAAETMVKLQSMAAIPSPFRFFTDKTVEAAFSVPVPTPTRLALGGQRGSVLDVYRGEYEWDKFDVWLRVHRGRDNGVTIRYGKNLTDIEQDRNIANVATGIMPYWVGQGGALVQSDPAIIPAEGTYSFQRIIPVNFSTDFETQPTPEQLAQRGRRYVTANDIGVPKVSIRVSFVLLEQYEPYTNLALLERCDLCDTVTVQYDELGVDAKAEIIGIKTDCLLERYISVQVGEPRGTLSGTIAAQQGEIDDKPSKSEISIVAGLTVSAILGAKGGTVRLLDENGDGEPDTLYIADDPDPAKAKKVWRFNYEGWGASKTGYNGPFTIAATLEDGFYADFIAAGVLNANLIRAGIIASEDGSSFWDLETGELQLRGYATAAQTRLEYQSQIQQSASQIRTEVSEKYETQAGSEEKYLAVQQRVDDLSVTASRRGGGNLLKGTSAYDLTGWEATGDAATTRSDERLIGAVQSGGAYLLPAGSSISQTVSVRTGEQYGWMARAYIYDTVSPDATITVAGTDTAVGTTDKWITLQGSFVAGSESTTVLVSNRSGALMLGDITLMPGKKITDWQQAANEIDTDNMHFSGGVLSVGGAQDDQHAEMSGRQFAITSNSTGKRLAYFAGNAAEFGRTIVRGSLTVEAEETPSGALAILPQGDGHVYIVVND